MCIGWFRGGVPLYTADRTAEQAHDMKRYQDAVLVLLVLAVFGQVLYLVIRKRPVEDAVAAGPTVLVGDTVGSLAGYVEEDVLALVPLDGDPGTVTVLYAFHSECAFCDDVAPAWASHFATAGPSGRRVRRIAVTRDLPGPAATYAEQFGWQVDLLSVSQLAETSREYSLVSRTPWVFVFDADGVLRFHDHGGELERVEQAVASIASAGAGRRAGVGL